MTRIESGVTIPKGLFTLYLNVKKVTAKIFWPPEYTQYTDITKRLPPSIILVTVQNHRLLDEYISFDFLSL
jgi:hypothetical protein